MTERVLSSSPRWIDDVHASVDPDPARRGYRLRRSEDGSGRPHRPALVGALELNIAGPETQLGCARGNLDASHSQEAVAQPEDRAGA